jgi:hypothetical protein
MTFVSPINTITLDCSGNVLPNAILLADVDFNKVRTNETNVDLMNV